MNDICKSILFNKHILVSDAGENQVETLCALADVFAINITSGAEFANVDVLRDVEKYMMTIRVPAPFYRGFPESVKSLSIEELMLDRMYAYLRTYGFNNFEESVHSVFEEIIERKVFNENVTQKDFIIVNTSSAVNILDDVFVNLLSGTRHLSATQMSFINDCIYDYNFTIPRYIPCKDTCVQLYVKHAEFVFLNNMKMSDIIKIVDYVNYNNHCSRNLNKLNLGNKERKLITNAINYMFNAGNVDTITCYEKKKIWCGLLHHIHYKANTDAKREFCNAMRGKGNKSVYSRFETEMRNRDCVAAANIIKDGKGNAALLRNINYIVSRCNDISDVAEIANLIDDNNGVVLLQLALQYANYNVGARDFVFTKYNLLTTHKETAEEQSKRKTVLQDIIVRTLNNKIMDKACEHYKNSVNLSKVYIDGEMNNIAMPIQETTSSGGYGVLPKGSCVDIPQGKIVRAFTYWEKVNDIDLSCFGLREDGSKIEFSWRSYNNDNVVTYSGDETSGYNGGSEFFDINIEGFKRMYSDVTHIVFCNNVYSNSTFSNCVCKAGFMLRDEQNSGEIFEPKTIETSYTINADSRFAYLFAIDLSERKMIWLNMSNGANTGIAGETNFDFLRRYFNMTDVLSVYKFVQMCNAEIVDDASVADYIFSDKLNGENIIHSYDIDKLVALLNM